ncbi:MAG: hypothetical protein IMW99_02135 [Firmicutes bacterium]|nr:hypothetical protein [Bacillota bacterium]
MGSYATVFSQKAFVLIASLPANDPIIAKEALNAGADVLKVHINLHHRASGQQFGSLHEEQSRLVEILRLARAKGVPVGIVPGAEPVVNLGLLTELRDMGFSFISAYAQHLGPEALTLTGIDRMIAPDYTYSIPEVTALGTLGFEVLEASVIPPDRYGAPLSLRDLARYHAIATAVPMPVVVPTQLRIQPEEVSFLRQAGVRGVMIGAVVTGRDAAGMARATQAFRRAIDGSRL